MTEKIEIGIVKEDFNYGTLIGYTINGMVVRNNSLKKAKKNVGKKVKFIVDYQGYRKYGMFTKDFYKGIKEII